ncbi:DUF1569 domain-containing protein [Pedobacter sp. Hv1]|uniref:DUF1569 domain-containing protein n=1 Tax=Pedobacter sp. Hv1 TaxID=1740090 RepID=UPI0006D8C1BD|nr:DUF1569 domain-containing protein [Pedobacter sp. Hv1]KQC02311.1 hypothetical protein AQF98_01665 [Pedobacter sp. Hv1]
MKSVFQTATTTELIQRINKLTPTTEALWGKMNVAQMLAHCCVTYEMAYENIHKAPNAFIKLMLRFFAKDTVVGDKPYKKNGPTAPAFIITETKDFEKEKARLIAYIEKTQALGEAFFDNKESLSFGKLSVAQWNTMFYKHLDYHLSQFDA